MAKHLLGTAPLSTSDDDYSQAIVDTCSEAETAWREGLQRVEFTDTPLLYKAHIGHLELLKGCFHDKLFITTMVVEEQPPDSAVLNLLENSNTLVTSILDSQKADQREAFLLSLQWALGSDSENITNMSKLYGSMAELIESVTNAEQAKSTKAVKQAMAKLQKEVFDKCDVEIEANNQPFFKWMVDHKNSEQLTLCHQKLRSAYAAETFFFDAPLKGEVVDCLARSKSQTIPFATLKIMSMPKIEQKGPGAVSRIALNKLFKHNIKDDPFVINILDNSSWPKMISLLQIDFKTEPHVPESHDKPSPPEPVATYYTYRHRYLPT